MAITAQNIRQKPGYKETEVGLIPEDWDVKKLGEVADFLDGRRRPINERDRATMRGEYPYYGASGIVDHVNDYIFDEDLILLGEDGENILSRNCKLAFQISGKTWVNNHAHVLRPKPNTSQDFLTEYLESLDYSQYNTGTAQPKLNKKVCLEIIVILPSLPEQRAIATALSDVDALITTLDKLIAKKRVIKQATMQQLLTGKTRLPGFSGEWEVKKLGEMFQFLNTANNSRSDLSENGEIKYIHYGDIHMKWRSFLDCSSDSIPFIQRNKVGNVPFLEDGDVVMADASEDYEGLGISVEVKNATGNRVVAGLHTLLLRGDKESLADGFKGYLQYIPAVKDALKKAATGISVYGISKNNVRNIAICLPDITEQRAIATALADMDAEIAALEQKRDKVRVLKQAMMQELLTGKTRLL